MIELKGISSYNGTFSYNDRTQKNIENNGAEFDKLIGGSFEKKPDSVAVAEPITDSVIEEVLIDGYSDVFTYDFWGKLLNSEMISGININVVV